MAGGVTDAGRDGVRRMARGCVVLAMAAACAAALALDDPTRPPPGLRSGGVKRAAGDEALVLQSVIISPSSRSAIINGEHVLLGGRIGAARLVKVSEAAVVLMIGGSQRRLELYPGVHKHAVDGGHAAE
jgi:hypothetical protein